MLLCPLRVEFELRRIIMVMDFACKHFNVSAFNYQSEFETLERNSEFETLERTETNELAPLLKMPLSCSGVTRHGVGWVATVLKRVKTVHLKNYHYIKI